MKRKWVLSMLFVLVSPLSLAQPAGGPDPTRLPPPVEHVLNELSLTPTLREQVRQTLLRQRQERMQADQTMRERHRSELAALLTPDQLVALDAARPPPPGAGERGPRPQPR